MITTIEREVVLHRRLFLSYNEAQAGKPGLFINEIGSGLRYGQRKVQIVGRKGPHHWQMPCLSFRVQTLPHRLQCPWGAGAGDITAVTIA